MKHTVVVTVVVLLLSAWFLVVLSREGAANPVTFDEGDNCGPIPYENSSIYLKSERIEVVFAVEERFSGWANVTASYTFKNENEKNNSITILLPFLGAPANLSIHSGETQIDHSWGFWPEYLNNSLHVNVSSKSEWWSHAAIFSLNFSVNEERTVIARYARNLHYSLNLEYECKGLFCEDYSATLYSFAYLVGTARHWNHSIEFAEFIFYIPKDEFHKGATGFFLKKESEYVVASKEYHNWTPERPDETVLISWETDEKTSRDFDENVFCLVAGPVIIGFIILALILVKKSKQSKGKR